MRELAEFLNFFVNEYEALTALLDSLQSSPGNNISTLLKKKRNPISKPEYIQPLKV